MHTIIYILTNLFFLLSGTLLAAYLISLLIDLFRKD